MAGYATLLRSGLFKITFSEQECLMKKELKSVYTEQWALKNGIEQFYYEVKCVETMMFNTLGT